MGPLTPDGNLELVDDYGSLEIGGKQFITVATKSGNYFISLSTVMIMEMKMFTS